MLDGGRPGLITYITAGDPTMDATLKFLEVIDKYADVIELGIPFSDPIADGKTIQKASVRALESGTTVDGVLDLMARFKKGSDTPIVLMTYYNLIFRRGTKKFMENAKDKGADGIIIVDLPLEEADEYINACREVGLKTIFLIAPNTDNERMEDIDDASTGFVYLVAHLGTTGERDVIPGSTLRVLKEAKSTCKNPIGVGFGISKPTHVAQLIAAGADAVIIGSAIVRLIEEHGRGAAPYIEEKLISFRKAIDETQR